MFTAIAIALESPDKSLSNPVEVRSVGETLA